MSVENLLGDPQSCNLCVHYLAKSHRELVTLFMDSLYGNPGGMSDEGLNDVLSLENLKFLKLYNTSVTGDRLDSGLGRSTSLETFSLINSHELTDHGLSKILGVIGENLKVLNLRSTGITGEFNFITNLTNLTELKLYYCWNLTDKGLNQILKICNHDKLSHLDIGCSSVTGEGLSELSQSFNKVKRINFEYGSNLTDKGLCQIFRLFGGSLKSLDLNNSAIIGEGLSEFTETLSNLEDLYCYDCSDLTDKGLCEIFRICGDSLVSFKAFLCPGISGEGLDGFQSVLPRLVKLDLSHTNLNDDGLVHIIRICGPNLLVLDIGDTKVTGDGLHGFEILDSVIEHLNLNSIPTLTEGGLAEIFRVCGLNIRLLNLSNINLTSCSFDGKLNNLRKLDLSGEDIQDSLLQDILKMCGTYLNRLNLRESQVTGEGLVDYTYVLSQLEELDLSHCSSLTEHGIKEILQISGASLKYLDISKNSLTFEFLSELDQPLGNLTELNLSNCKQLTDVGLQEILKISGGSLRRLDIERTSVSDEFRSVLEENFTNIQIMD